MKQFEAISLAQKEPDTERPGRLEHKASVTPATEAAEPNAKYAKI